MTEIKTGAFCGLSRSEDFQQWLKVTAEDLYDDLIKTLTAAKGCRANTNKMMEVYSKLSEKGLEPHLISFLQRRFPWILKGGKKPETFTPGKLKEEVPGKRKYAKTTVDVTNKHNVFKAYKPNVLSFPQKLVMVGNPATLYQEVQKFAHNKLGVDYLIIEDHAYIEYFDIKYAAVVDKIPRESRDIYNYRKRLQQNEDQ